MDGYDVGVIAEPAHRLGLAADPGDVRLLPPVTPDDGDCHMPFQSGVYGQEDALAAALTQEALYLVAARCKEAGQSGRRHVTSWPLYQIARASG